MSIYQHISNSCVYIFVYFTFYIFSFVSILCVPEFSIGEIFVFLEFLLGEIICYSRNISVIENTGSISVFSPVFFYTINKFYIHLFRFIFIKFESKTAASEFKTARERSIGQDLLYLFCFIFFSFVFLNNKIRTQS